VVHKELVRNVCHPQDVRTYGYKVLAEYGIGYSFIKSPAKGLFAYGPGRFDAALELINFRIYETGYISVRMVFIANRPQQTMNVTVDPVDWGFRLADTFSLGFASRLFAPAKNVLSSLPFRFSFDPVSVYLAGTNAISGGAAARNLCISMETLEKLFLAQHFRQHYQTVIGSLETWRRVPDWTDLDWLRANAPWIISGVTT
jgi:hypothetical protein